MTARDLPLIRPPESKSDSLVRFVGLGVRCSDGEREGMQRLVALLPCPADANQLHLERRQVKAVAHAGGDVAFALAGDAMTGADAGETLLGCGHENLHWSSGQTSGPDAAAVPFAASR